MLILRLLAKLFSVGLMGLVVSVVSGQDYPNRPVRIVTVPAGANSDFVARQLAQGISVPLGQPVVVENRTAIQAIEAVAKASPDGYTLLVASVGLWITPLLQKVSYDAVRDFSPISLLSRQVLVVAVHPSVPARSVKELIALAKARPGELNYGAGGAGGSAHLASELFKSMAGGLNIVRVAYKGTAPAMTGLITGEVQLMITDSGLVEPHMKAGRLRTLGVTSATPSTLAPGLPPIATAGLPGYEWVGMTHIVAPAKTPATIVNRLSHEIVRTINLPEMKARLFNAGEEIIGSSPEQLAATIRSETAKVSKVIKDAGIKVE